MEDIDIVIKAVNNDKDAFVELMHLREKKLYKIAYMYVKNKQCALDIVGETVYKAYLNIKKLRNYEYFDICLCKPCE